MRNLCLRSLLTWMTREDMAIATLKINDPAFT